MTPKTALPRMWWTRGRPFSLAELIADGVVHGIGLAVAATLGTVLLIYAGLQTAPTAMPALIVYVATLRRCSAFRWRSTSGRRPRRASGPWRGSIGGDFLLMLEPLHAVPGVSRP